MKLTTPAMCGSGNPEAGDYAGVVEEFKFGGTHTITGSTPMSPETQEHASIVFRAALKELGLVVDAWVALRDAIEKAKFERNVAVVRGAAAKAKGVVAMTPDEYEQLPNEQKLKVERLEQMARELMLDLGPARVCDLLRTIAADIAGLRFSND